MNEQNRFAAAPCPAGAADAVHVGFAIERQVVIDHVADALHVESARGHVGGDQHVELAAAEVIDDPFALFLGDVAVEHGRAMAAIRREIRPSGSLVSLRLDEHDHAVDRFGLQNAVERGLLLMRSGHDESLPHGVGRGGLLSMVISAGLVRCFCAMRRIGAGNVAENRAVCRVARGTA